MTISNLPTSSTGVSTYRLLRSILFCVMLMAICAAATAQNNNVTASIEHDGQTFFGKPLGWDGKQYALMSRSGRLNLIPADSRQDLHLVANKFLPFTQKELRDLLLKEFGSRYDVSTTRNFVVVHPWGDPKIWASPFEDFHRNFTQFFKSRGVELSKPEVPMVALVLRSRSDFNRSLINELEIRDARIAGFYSRLTNRITTYDPGGFLRVGEDKWMYRAGPIIHEATHQSAFNTGIHNRFAPPPKWLSEGLATMFEARGFNDAGRFAEPYRGVNETRLEQLRKYLGTDAMNAGLINLIANDKLFRSHPELAYSLSWGLSFFLLETQPEKYLEHLMKDAGRRNFDPYPSDMRLRNFMAMFGNDFEKIESDLNQYFRKR